MTKYTDNVDISFKCDACGSQLLWEDDLGDDETVTCPNCGKEGPTLGELKAAAFQTAKELVEKVVGKDSIKWEPE